MVLLRHHVISCERGCILGSSVAIDERIELNNRVVMVVRADKALRHCPSSHEDLDFSSKEGNYDS